MRYFSELKYGLKYFFLNSIVNRIPIWCIRKSLYKLCGLKIGKSHILMHVIIDGCKYISIGDGVCINEYCHLDGRGGIIIGDNTSISIYTRIISAAHDKDDPNFKYVSKPIVIGNRVWVGVGSTILAGTEVSDGVVLAAGCVATQKKYKSFTVYAGVPALEIGKRNKNLSYQLAKWNPIFR